MTCSDVSVVDVIMFSSHFSQLSLCYIVIIINIINVSVCVYTRVCVCCSSKETEEAVKHMHALHRQR